MENLFMILILLTPIIFVVGMFKPEWVIFWNDLKRSRKRVTLYTGGFFFFSFIMFGILADLDEETSAKRSDSEIKIASETDINEEIEIVDETEDVAASATVEEEIAEEATEVVEESATEKKMKKSNDELAIPPPNGELKVHYINVGQGDATLLQGPDFSILIDAGRHNASDVVPYLRNVGVKELDLVIGTHPHADHIGQMDKVINNFKVKEVWLSGDTTTSQTFERVLDAILSSNANYHEPRKGETFKIGSSFIEVLNPSRISGDLHAGSVSVRIHFGDVKFVFTGDAESQTEQAMINSGMSLEGQIFQMGHHGSKTSNTKAFLQAVKPEIAIYSASSTNQYGHPHAEVIDRFKDMGIDVYGTDVHGHIIVTTDGKTYKVDTNKSGTVTSSGSKSTSISTTSNSSSTSGSSSSDNASSANETKKQEEVKVASCGPGTVAVNSASLEELQQIIHIGPERAKDIIDTRSSPFTSYSSLTRLKGIGDARAKDIEKQGIVCFD